MKVKSHTIRKHARLFSSIISAIIIISFITPFSTINAYAIDSPQPTYPANYASTNPDTDPPLGVPSFSWSPVAGANIYRLQVDGEIGFNQPIYMEITTRNTSFTPSGQWSLFSDGEWYWRVRVDDPAPVSEWSPIFRFTKTWATPEHKPSLLAPLDGEKLAFFDSPAFSWTPVIGAAKYRYQIASTPYSFDTPVYSWDTITTSYQPPNRISNGIYYWRVVPVDANDHLGTPSNVLSFTMAYGTEFEDMIPTLISPVDESEPTFTPTFHWTAIKGAEHYRLEYTSDETCDFSVAIPVETRQTFFTPLDTFTNDFRYCWRVRVESGQAIGDWSPVWHFKKRWDLTPTLLTPKNLYQTGLYPLYSWTPVPGASRYLIQISPNINFSPIIEESVTANTTYTPRNYELNYHYYWRVTPKDGGDRYGVESNVSEFVSISDSEAPILIYPLYYYEPNNQSDFPMNPYEDRTVAFPIFIWHRVMVPPPVGGIYAHAYRIQVDETPYFDTVEWEYETENTSATPTKVEDFNPTPDQDYFWRVCPLQSINSINCLKNPDTNLDWWSQIWTAHFSPTLELSPTIGVAPELLRPITGQEAVEATPLLEWWPLEGAIQYQVEVSRDENFTTDEISETVNIPAYSPKYSLAQRNLGMTDYGTFYWRVRGFTADGWSNWSEIWRFQIAAQSEWRFTRSLGDPANQQLVGDDPISDTLPSYYDLMSLYVSQAKNYWYLGFNAEISTTNMTYVFYLDLNNVEGSGGTTPPERGYQVTTVPEHQPEYVIYVDVVNGVVDRQNTWVFAWDGDSWGYGQRFIDIGANVFYAPDYVELEIPYSAIGMNETTCSMSMMLFSVDTSTGEIQDTVPSDPQVPGDAVLSRFSSVSERFNLVSPPSIATGDPTTISSILPFFWDWPTGSNGSTPFAGSVLQVDTDQNYSEPHEAELRTYSNSAYISQNNVTHLWDIIGDNIYWWRVQPRYLSPGGQEAFGAWTGGWSFNRYGSIAQSLTTSISFATPTFHWDMAEGANTYHLQVATDFNFGNIIIDVTTPMTQFTPLNTLAQDTYYWRVEISRIGGVINDRSNVQQFNLSLPTPTGLTPDNGELVHYAPTFCWDPLVGYNNGEPVMTAWRYLVQVSTDPSFSSLYDSVDTTNNCWTPYIGYQDGTYYWRVAMVDGNNTYGSFSPSATFTKQYPITTLISPIYGIIPHTPTFIWTPVDGATMYYIQTSWYPTFDPVYDSLETINIQYTPTFIYEKDKTYYWRVAIRDRYGRQGPFTDAEILIGLHSNFYLPIIRR